MPFIVVKCSRTGRNVSTEMAADLVFWFVLFFGWIGEPYRCPQCSKMHVWTKTDARIDAAWRSKANVALIEQ